MNNFQRHILSIAFIGFLLLHLSCEDKPSPSRTGFEEALVVEGAIESGRLPRVFITRNMPYYIQLDSMDFYYLMIRQASVFLSDGVSTEALTLRYDKNMFPPYYYQGTQIRGEAGKTYSLTINYGQDTQLNAVTTVPYPVSVDSIWFAPTPGDTSKGTIGLRIINSNTNAHYRFLTRIHGKQDQYFPTQISSFNTNFFADSIHEISLSKGPESYLSINEKDFLFSAYDTIFIKVCTMDNEQFEFWRSYQMQVVGGTNPFSASPSSLVSNIEGGLGNWGGYGVSVYRFIPRLRKQNNSD